jgi:type I restriction enzyme S subunit
MQGCVDWWGGASREGRVETAVAWKVSADEVKARGYNLDFKNPHTVADDHGDPAELLSRLNAADANVNAMRGQLKAIFQDALAATNAAHLLANFDRLSDSPEAVPLLRRFILDLAVRGKLVAQDANDEPAAALLKRIQSEKARLVKLGLAKAGKTPPDVESGNASTIPPSWQWSRLSEVGFISPRNIASDDQLVSFVPMPMIAAAYGIPNRHEVRPWREIKTGYTHFVEGDVGLAKITPCFENGKSTIFRGLTGGIGAGTTELHIVRPVLTSADYILIFIKSSRYIATGIPLMTGTAGQKRVPSDYFTQSPFPLPPLAEQSRIVAKVDELMALCDQLEAQLTTTQTDSRRLLEAVLEAALVSDANSI